MAVVLFFVENFSSFDLPKSLGGYNKQRMKNVMCEKKQITNSRKIEGLCTLFQKLETKNLFNFSQKMFFLCLLVFIFGLGFGEAEAATYYVDTIGTNNGSCGTASGANACASLSYLVATRGLGTSGDNILIQLLHLFQQIRR